MSRHFDKAFDATKGAKAELLNLFRKAREESWTHERLLNATSPIIARDFGPRWASSEIYGYKEALRDHIMQDLVVFAYEYEGEWFAVGTSWNKTHNLRSTEELASIIGWPAVSNLQGKFLWAHSYVVFT